MSHPKLGKINITKDCFFKWPNKIFSSLAEEPGKETKFELKTYFVLLPYLRTMDIFNFEKYI